MGEGQSWSHDLHTHSLLSLATPTPLPTEPCVEDDRTSLLRRRNERPREIEWERCAPPLSSVGAVGAGLSCDRKKRGSGISSSVTRTSMYIYMSHDIGNEHHLKYLLTLLFSAELATVLEATPS